jgi:signal transduction histidine kinase
MMQPSAAERMELGLIFGVMAIAMAVVVWWLPRIASRNRSVRVTVAALSVTSFIIVVVSTVVVANRMFISEHDLTLLLVVFAFGVASALGFALTVSRSLTDDLDRLYRSAQLVAEGELDALAELDRRDEIGQLGEAIDQMILRLETVEAQREADSQSQRAFFAAVGHDLRTPLSSLRLAIEAMQDGLAADQASFLAAMEKDVAALSHLVDDVFLLARLDSGALDVETSVTDITEIVDEAIDVLRPVARSKGVELGVAATGSVLAVAHHESMGRVLRNVIENAIRHTPKESTVSVEVVEAAGEVVVQVVDQGAGFDPEFLPDAFDRFSRDDPSRDRGTGGSGLGLAIARGLVSAQGGSIWAEPGPGGRVGIRLAAIQPESSQLGPSDIGRADLEAARH